MGAGDQTQCTNILNNIISDTPRGVEHVWVVGDKFVADTSQRYFLNIPENDSFSKQNFEVSSFFTMRPEDEEDSEGMDDTPKNMLTRVYNCLISAMRRESTVPKMVLVVLEDDLINYVAYDDFGVSALYGKLINSLAGDMRAAAAEFKKKYLPAKATKQNWPQFIWVTPSMHVNYANNTLRKKFGTEIEKMLDFFNDTHAFRYGRNDWDCDRQHLVSAETKLITNNGARRLWRAIDKIVCNANEILFSSKNVTGNTPQQRDDYHWQANRGGHGGNWRNWHPNKASFYNRNANNTNDFRRQPPHPSFQKFNT